MQRFFYLFLTCLTPLLPIFFLFAVWSIFMKWAPIYIHMPWLNNRKTLHNMFSYLLRVSFFLSIILFFFLSFLSFMFKCFVDSFINCLFLVVLFFSASISLSVSHSFLSFQELQICLYLSLCLSLTLFVFLSICHHSVCLSQNLSLYFQLNISSFYQTFFLPSFVSVSLYLNL